jgi:hypothetical protein
MDTSNAPPDMWYLCLEYVTYILNWLSTPSLNGRTPLSMINGQVPDISMILYYHFYEPVYYAHYDSSTKTQPTHTTSERLGYFAGFSENVGHTFTFLVVSHDTREVLHRSRLRSAKDGERNLRADVASNKIKASDISDTYELLASHKFRTFDISDAYDVKELPPNCNGSHYMESPIMGSPIMGSLLLARNNSSTQTFPHLMSSTSVILTKNHLIQNHLPHYYHHLMIHDFWPENFSLLMTRRHLSVRLSYCHHKPTVTKIVPKSSNSFNSLRMMSSRTPNMSNSVSKSTIQTSTRILSRIPKFWTTLRTPKNTPIIRIRYGNSNAFPDIKVHYRRESLDVMVPNVTYKSNGKMERQHMNHWHSSARKIPSHVLHMLRKMDYSTHQVGNSFNEY